MFLLAIFLGIACLVARGEHDETLINKICNGEENGFGNYQDNKEAALLDLVQKTPGFGGYDYNHVEGQNDAVCYVHASCNPSIPREDCRFCLVSITNEIDMECRMNIGARIEYKDCRVRFEKYNFFGTT
ncbi:hypothetical protein MLD38_025084 [Melastoma candidum]|nr:hypothetical protein MLD38_025084 [Melastoma candidum]